MKWNKKTYLLVFAVLGVWGTVIYKLIVGSGGDDAQLPTVTQMNVTPEVESSLPDTFHIVAKYRDPFLGKTTARKSKRANQVAATTPKNPTVRKAEPKPVEPAPALPWPEVNYNGMVVNSADSAVVALVSIGQSDALLELGGTFNEIELVAIHADSIRVSFQGESRTITK